MYPSQKKHLLPHKTAWHRTRDVAVPFCVLFANCLLIFPLPKDAFDKFKFVGVDSRGVLLAVLISILLRLVAF